MAELLSLYPLLADAVWTVVVIAVLIVVSLVISLRGTAPAERPEIIRALGDLFRSFRRLKRGGDSPADERSSKPIDSP